MVIKNSSQRVAVFMDVQNMYHSAKNLYHARVNFKNLLLEAVSGRHLIRAIAYTARADEPGESSFFDALEKAGIETRIKDLQVYPDGTKKGDWDVGLAVDAIRLSSNVDAVVIVSGDGDYVPLVQYLQALGKQVEVMAFGRTTSGFLREAVDEFMDLDSRSSYFLLRTPMRHNKRGKFSKIIPIKFKK